jgi:hypothetical protein
MGQARRRNRQVDERALDARVNESGRNKSVKIMPKVARNEMRHVVDRLRALFVRNGYVRRQNRERLAEGADTYKKGDEIRLVADTRAEVMEIRRLLRQAGFRPGRPFAKANQYRQPLYGREAVKRFLELIGEG